MEERQKQSSEQTTMVKNNDIKRYVLTLSEEDFFIKQNIKYLVSSFEEKEHRLVFIEKIGIDQESLTEFMSPECKIMPTSDVIKKIERHFEDYHAMDENSCKLNDAELLLKMQKLKLNVIPSLRNVERIKRNIKILRTGHKETQVELANAIGVNWTAISNYENFQNKKIPAQEKLIAIAKHYKITVDMILENDLNQIVFNGEVINSKDFHAELLNAILPFKEYSVFHKRRNEKTLIANKLHAELYKYVIDYSIEDHVEELETVLRLYDEAVHEGCHVAAANH